MKIRSIAIASISAIVAIIIATSLANTSSTKENVVRVAFLPNVGHAAAIIGIEKGFFENELGDTKIKTLHFESGPQIIESIYANSIDIAYVGPGPAVNGFLKSDKNGIKVLAGAASGGTSFIINPKSEIKSASDLEGKKIAAPPIGNTQDVSLRQYLKENGLKPAEKGGNVIIFNLSPTEIYTLFAKGDIDAAWVPEPWASRFVIELDGIRLFNEEELWSDGKFASVLLIASEKFIENNPDVTLKWINANKKSVTWINENPIESQTIFNDFMKKELGKPLKEKVLTDSFSNIQITDNPIKESIYIFAERANSHGYLGRHGYNLDGIFFEVPNLEKQEVLILNG